jgi:predicted nucleotidyltransferase
MVETGTHAEELARHVVEALVKGLSGRLVAVVLFGSRAHGEGSETSDWDLPVIAEVLPAKTIDRNLYLK